VDAIDLYGMRRPAGEAFDCTVVVRGIDEQSVAADIAVGDGQGSYMTISGWTDKRLYMPPQLLPLSTPLGMEAMTEPWQLDREPGSPRMYACRRLQIDKPREWEFLCDVWAMRSLSRDERLEYLQLPGDERLDWLATRQAGKEAVQSLLLNYYGLRILPADILVIARPDGAWVAGGHWRSAVADEFEVSISRVQGAYVAVAALLPIRVDPSSRAGPGR
jgi:hypothetical protein